MTTLLRPFLKILPLAGLLFLAACPQMTTGAISGAGSPLSATGEKASSTDTTDKAPGADELVPSAAAPVPTPGGGDAGGLGGAGSGGSDAATAMRRVDGAPSETPAGEAIPVSGPVVARDSRGGVLGSPSLPEHIGSGADNLRVVYWPASVRRNWSDARDFFAKLAAGQISETAAQGATVFHYGVMLFPPLEGDPPVIVARKEDLLTNDLVQSPGYYLFFFTSDESKWEMGPETMGVTSVAQLKSLVQTDQFDDEGRAFEIAFLGERTIASPLPMIDGGLLKYFYERNVPVDPRIREHFQLTR
ncbi:MAG TPA: hypothetical protein VFX30_10950 [bacterium]|nr:hypothetical protein [bacterium]